MAVGWLGRASTTLHCTHHVLTCRLKRHHSVFSFESLFVHVRGVLARLCAPPLLVFGQDVQLSMAAVQASGSPCSQPDWSCITLNENVSVPTPGSSQALV